MAWSAFILTVFLAYAAWFAASTIMLFAFQGIDAFLAPYNPATSYTGSQVILIYVGSFVGCACGFIWLGCSHPKVRIKVAIVSTLFVWVAIGLTYWWFWYLYELVRDANAGKLAREFVMFNGWNIQYLGIAVLGVPLAALLGVLAGSIWRASRRLPNSDDLR